MPGRQQYRDALVNMFNTIFIYLFSALVAGRVVVVSQYIGRRNQENCNRSFRQLLMVPKAFSIFITGFVLMLNR